LKLPLTKYPYPEKILTNPQAKQTIYGEDRSYAPKGRRSKYKESDKKKKQRSNCFIIQTQITQS
jgi:hypothetical protein